MCIPLTPLSFVQDEFVDAVEIVGQPHTSDFLLATVETKISELEKETGQPSLQW